MGVLVLMTWVTLLAWVTGGGESTLPHSGATVRAPSDSVVGLGIVWREEFRDDKPKDGKPDGWTIVTEGGATCVLHNDETDTGNRFLSIEQESGHQWTAVARPAADLIQPDRWYRLSFRYRTTRENPPWAGWRLMDGGMERSLNVLGADLRNPVADDAWHAWTSGPFRVPAEQLTLYPFLAFRVPMNFIGTIEIDDVGVEPN